MGWCARQKLVQRHAARATRCARQSSAASEHACWQPRAPSSAARALDRSYLSQVAVTVLCCGGVGVVARAPRPHASRTQFTSAFHMAVEGIFHRWPAELNWSSETSTCPPHLSRQVHRRDAASRDADEWRGRPHVALLAEGEQPFDLWHGVPKHYAWSC